MKNKILSVAVFLLLLNIFSYGQQNPKSKPLTANIAALNKKLDSLFSSYNNSTSPGCAVTILENGKVIAKKAYGMANIENKVPFTHQSVVKIPYSEAREFISIAVVFMEKDGVLSLNDKVRKYFPKLPDWSASVTLWDLLNHRSGFVDEWATLLLMHNNMANRFEKEQFLRLLYTQATPQIEPGKGYMYCNSDFGLLRLIMEKASDKKLPDWMKQRIFEPLKMASTSMQKSALDIIPNRADVYVSANGGGYEHNNVQKTSPGGNYFILSSANDLERWTAAISNPTSEISQAAVKLMTNVRQIPGRENHFVIGYSIRNINNTQVILHEGVNGYNYLSRIPSKGLAVITFGNKHDEGFAPENKAIINYLLKVPAPALPKLMTTPITLTVNELKKYTGNYRWLNKVSWEGYRQPKKFSTLFIANGKLNLRYTGNYVIPLTPVGKDTFYYKEEYGAQFEFKQTTPNEPTILTVTFDDGFPGETMAKDTGAIWQPSKEVLAGFIGKYYSKHLDYFWNIAINEDGQLVLKRNTLPDAIIEPDGLNQFHYIAEKSPGAGFDQWLLFNKDEKGTITGITVWSARVMFHEFEKQ